MKLLPKKTVDLVVTEEKRIAIKEGMDLASRIDALRQTLSNLEKNYAEFITGMENQIKVRTEGLVKEMTGLQSEIVNLKDERKRLLIPLDDAWLEVTEKQKELARHKDEVIAYEAKVSEKEGLLNKRLKEEKEVLNRINVRERELNRVYLSQEQIETEKQQVLDQTKETSEKTLANLNERSMALLTREKELDSIELSLNSRQEQVEMAEEANEAKAKQLTDREQLLERNLKRIENGKRKKR